MTKDTDFTNSPKEIDRPQIYRANSFVAEGCEGNPAGVCLLPDAREEEFYKKIAIAMDCAETAFVYKKDGVLQLCWFTRSGIEVDLCGHATLAASWILFSRGYNNPDTVTHFNTKSGILSASFDSRDVVLDFPLEKIETLKKDENGLAGIIGTGFDYLGKTRFDYFAVAGSEDAVTGLHPDLEKLAEVTTRGIIVTARSRHKEYDFVSRFFAPAIGIDEDPVTGSAHCALAYYWGKILKKNTMTGYQASREGGMVGVNIKKDRVFLSGKVREVPLTDEFKREIGI